MLNQAIINKLESIRKEVLDELDLQGIKYRKTFYDAVLYEIPAITIDVVTPQNVVPSNVRSILDKLNYTDANGYTKGHYTSSGKKLKFVVVPKKESK